MSHAPSTTTRLASLSAAASAGETTAAASARTSHCCSGGCTPTCGTRGKDFIAWKEHTLCGGILDVLGDIDDGFESGDVLECLQNVDLNCIIYKWRNVPDKMIAVALM